MASLTITNNSVANPLTLDLTKYMNVQRDAGMDVSDPAFSERVWARSLLKEGATLALESLHEKELVFPLELNATTLSAVLTQIQQINQIVTTPGATCSWQADGASQATTFDVLSGQVDVEYDFRREGQKWTSVKLRIFTQPLGRTASPRRYATASGVGPLLMISPYASTGALAVSASTQAGLAGFGGQQQGASSGVFYWGAPSLAGDAGAPLQISYVGPLPNTATNTGVVPYVAVSLLPDQNYNPLITAPQIAFANLNAATSRRSIQTSVASACVQLATGASLSVQDIYSFSPVSGAAIGPPVAWAGQHRLLAIARASSANAGGLAASLSVEGGPLTQSGQVVRIANQLDWALYDLGTLALKASQLPGTPVQINAQLTAGASAALDLAALVMLPDATTWFLNPTAVQPSQYGYPPNLASTWGQANAPWTNALLVDDVIGDQFMYYGPSQTFAPSPLGSIPSSARISQFSRGLIPRPDPKNGPPIIAIVGVGQNQDPAVQGLSTLTTESFGPNGPGTGADDASTGTVAWSNPGNITALDDPGSGDPTKCAVVSLGSGAFSHWLKATNFGFNIPSSATIRGIQVDVRRGNFNTTSTIVDQGVRLIAAGTIQTPEKADTSHVWASGMNWKSYGGPTDLWGGSWAPSDINNSGFGWALSVVNFSASGNIGYVDYVQVTVWFSIGQSATFLGASQANPQNLRTMAQVNVLERTRYVLP